MKTKAFAKTLFALAVIAVFALAFALVACEDMFGFPGQNKDEIEYMDWQYEELPSGVGMLTLTLDGTTPFAHSKVNQRALSEGLAKMAHDYFEAVFVNSSGVVARASWEIGMPAGISGVTRGLNYGPITQSGTNGASVIFVGKKTGKTLLGIGHLVKVDDTWNVTTIAPDSKSVTFGVYPLITTGLTFTDVNQLGPNSPFKTDYLTSGGAVRGRNISLYGGTEYALFELPEPPATTTTTAGLYTFRNTTGGATTAHPQITLTTPGTSLFDAAIVIDSLEFIKRVPSFLYKGQTYEAVGEVMDTYTDVVATNNLTTGSALVNPITVGFRQKVNSTGIFAITFQVPVYAITGAASDNNKSLDPVRWYVRPGYNQYQYLLDDGEGAGGMVMLGSGVAGLDWLDIFTVGIGFTN